MNFHLRDDNGCLVHLGVHRDTTTVDESAAGKQKTNFFQATNSTMKQPNLVRRASESIKSKAYANVMPMTNFEWTPLPTEADAVSGLLLSTGSLAGETRNSESAARCESYKKAVQALKQQSLSPGPK